MDPVFSGHPYHNRHSLGAIISGITIFGMVLVIIGLYDLNEVCPFISIDTDTFNMAKLIMMFLVLVMGVYALSQHAVMEGTVMLLSGISAVVLSASELLGQYGGLDIMDVLIGFSFILISLSFLARRDFTLAIGTIVLGVGTITYPFFGDVSYLITGSTSFVAGALYTMYGFIAWFHVCTHKEEYPWQNDEIADSANDAVGTAGFLIMGILSIIVGLYYLNNVLHFMDIPSIPYNIVKVLMAAMILYYAALALRDGAITSGMMSLFFGSSTFTFSVSALLQNTGEVEIMNFMFGLGMLMACVVSVRERNVSPAIVGFLVFTAFSIYPFFSGDVIYYMVGIPILLVGLIMSINSSRYIYRLEIRAYEE